MDPASVRTILIRDDALNAFVSTGNRLFVNTGIIAKADSALELIGVLAHHRREADITLAKTIGQGFDMGRPSVLQASAEKKDGTVVATYIGGRCKPMMSGVIELE